MLRLTRFSGHLGPHVDLDAASLEEAEKLADTIAGESRVVSW